MQESPEMARHEPSSIWDHPVTDAQLDQFYGVELSDTAIAIGEEHVIDNMELVAEFFSECSDEREPAEYFGPISTPDLVRQVLFNKESNDQQLGAAARELRARLVRHFDGLVMKRAQEAQ